MRIRLDVGRLAAATYLALGKNHESIPQSVLAAPVADKRWFGGVELVRRIDVPSGVLSRFLLGACRV